jgi:hypothetical protein
MNKTKLLILSLSLLALSACSDDNSPASASNKNHDSDAVKIEKGKVTFSIISMVDGNDQYRGDGCATKMQFINGLDESVVAHVQNYDIIHTQENILHTGMVSKKTIKAGESKITKMFMGGLSCKEITGLKIRRYSCTTASELNCIDKFMFVNTDKIIFEKDLWKR